MLLTSIDQSAVQTAAGPFHCHQPRVTIYPTPSATGVCFEVLRVNVRYETLRILRNFETIALIVRVSEEARMAKHKPLRRLLQAQRWSILWPSYLAAHPTFSWTLFSNKDRDICEYWAPVWALHNLDSSLQQGISSGYLHSFYTSLLPVSDTDAKLQACAAENQISINLGRPAIIFMRTTWRYRMG